MFRLFRPQSLIARQSSLKNLGSLSPLASQPQRHFSSDSDDNDSGSMYNPFFSSTSSFQSFYFWSPFSADDSDDDLSFALRLLAGGTVIGGAYLLLKQPETKAETKTDTDPTPKIAKKP